MTKEVVTLVTGGTIDTRKTPSGTRELANLAPQGGEDFPYGYDKTGNPIRIDSSDLYGPYHWPKLAKRAIEYLNDNNVGGIVITYGTDTMTRTAQFLQLALRDLTKPVIITGAQRGQDEPLSDGEGNKLAAMLAAKKIESGLVGLVFNDLGGGRFGGLYISLDDQREPCVNFRVMNPENSSKENHEAVTPFKTRRPDYGEVTADGHFELYDENLPNVGVNSKSDTWFDDKWNWNVDTIRVDPTMTSAKLKKRLQDLDGVVLEGLGAGHFRADENSLGNIDSLLDPVRDFNGPIIMTSEADGTVSPSLYGIAKVMYSNCPNLIPGGDLRPENAELRLMYLLGHGLVTSDIKKKIGGRYKGHTILTLPFEEIHKRI